MAFPSPAPSRELRVLVVDDSAFMRHSIERMLVKLPGVSVCGMAKDGVEAVQKALELRPDVITMDVEMPRMDGVTAVSEIMKSVPTPIVMLSTMTTEGAETTLRALEAGAVDFVAKPSHLSHQLVNVGDQLADAIVHARSARVRRRHLMRPATGAPATAGTSTTISGLPSAGIVVIGSSTGGPPALSEVVPNLPGDLSCGVVVVQHMPAGFTAALSRRLDTLSPLHVAEAKEGDPVVAGHVLVAPGDYHVTIGKDRRVHLNQDPQVHGVRPSVDVTLETVAQVYGARATVAILTGMGRDGADGSRKVEDAGGRIIVQDEETCVVYGMPRVAKERTQRPRQVPLERVADTIVESVALMGRAR